MTDQENPIAAFAQEKTEGFNRLVSAMLFELDALVKDGVISEQVCAVMGEKLIRINHDLIKRVMIIERQKRL